MSNNGQTPEQAKSDADKFVRAQLKKAKELLLSGDMDQAYFEFGVGLHTLQDATSPAHSGFQEWDGNESLSEIKKHVTQELFYPGRNSNLQKVTNKYLNWFQSSDTSLPSENLFNSIKSD